MTKRFISHDDEGPGTGLPAIVEERLNSTYGTKAEVAAAAAASEGAAKATDEANLMTLERRGWSDRQKSITSAQMRWQDGDSFTDDPSTLAGWTMTTPPGLKAADGWIRRDLAGSRPAAVRALAGIDTPGSTSQIEAMLKVGPERSGTTLTLVGFSRTPDDSVARVLEDGMIGIGVNAAGVAIRYPGETVISGATMDSGPLPDGEYKVVGRITPTEYQFSIHSADGSNWRSYRTGRASYGEVKRAFIWNSVTTTNGHAIRQVAARRFFGSPKTRPTTTTTPSWSYYANPTDPCLVGLPAGWDMRRPLPLVIYAHGYGDVGDEVMGQPAAMQSILREMINSGYMVAAPNLGGSQNWGNPTSSDQLVLHYQYLRDNFPIGPIILIGHSMGGLATLTALRKRRIPGVVGWVGVEPVCSLRAMYDQNYANEHAGTIRTAYGIASDGSDYAAKTAGYDPMVSRAPEFRGVPMLMFASPGDSVVRKVNHADALAAKIAPYQPDVQVITASGPHVDPSHFQPAVVRQWCDRIVNTG